MTMLQEIQNQSRSGAESVFQYIHRVAKRTADGVCWSTDNFYSQEPEHVPHVYTGVAGISLFLSDYFRFSDNPTARDLASDALTWCSTPGRPLWHQDTWSQFENSLGVGHTGIGLGWLWLSRATDDQKALAKAAEYGERLLHAEPGPEKGLLLGAVGVGIFLLRLYETSRDERFLTRAVEYAQWLISEGIDDVEGLGMGVGFAGIGHFWLLLHELTGEDRWAGRIREVAGILDGYAQPDGVKLNWPKTTGDPVVKTCQWCHGGAGIGMFYAGAYRALKDDVYLDTARRAAESTFAWGDDRGNPSQCHGLAGKADLLFQLHRLTQDPLWLERTHDFVERILSYRKTTPEGDLWQADEPESFSPEYMMGSAGVGHFFLRLINPGRFHMPLT